jgi:hypothetical protein
MRRSVLVLLPLLLAAGCVSLYDVHRGDTAIAGVPFFVQAGACTQQTMYVETLYRVAVQLPAPAGQPPVVLMEKVLRESAYLSGAMITLRSAMQSEQTTLANVLTAFNSLPAFNPADRPEARIASNVVRPDSFVDYSVVHYVNVKRPWIGSASATAKINGNGTLAEGAADVEDKTAASVLSALPIKELLTAAVPRAAGELETLTPGRTPALWQLSVAPQRFRYVITKTTGMDAAPASPAKSAPSCAARPGLAIDDATANSVREAVEEDRATSADRGATGKTGDRGTTGKTGGAQRLP